MRNSWTLEIWILGFSLALAPTAHAMDLKTFLQEVASKHRGLEALRLSREGAEDRRLAGDLVLTPTLSLKGGYLSDKKQPNQLGATELLANEYSAALAKRFSSGTSVSLTARSGGYENVGVPAAYAAYGKFSQGALGINISQSLWKDFFGRSTGLRHERENAAAEAEKSGYDLQARQILFDAEAAFWDALYLNMELQLRRTSLERARRIETWIGRRVGDGISDRADLLSAKALAASRQLQLIATEDELAASQRRLRDFLETDPSQPLPPLEGDLSQRRTPEQLLTGEGTVTRLDVWLAAQESKARAAGALEAEDSVRADLVLSGGYNTNSYEPNGTASDAARTWNKTDTPTTQVGVSWVYMFDTDAKNSVVGSARKEAMAAKLRSERKSREGETAWVEMNRRHGELSKRIDSADQIRRLQSDRAKAEQDKYGKGRSITSNVINSEQDAAEADLTFMRLQAEQRKLEAQTRLFIRVKE